MEIQIKHYTGGEMDAIFANDVSGTVKLIHIYHDIIFHDYENCQFPLIMITAAAVLHIHNICNTKAQIKHSLITHKKLWGDE